MAVNEKAKYEEALHKQRMERRERYEPTYKIEVFDNCVIYTNLLGDRTQMLRNTFLTTLPNQIPQLRGMLGIVRNLQYRS